jgi:hypothetical protein
MRARFSAKKYNEDEWQIVIVGISGDMKNMIKHYLDDIMNGRDDSEDHMSLVGINQKPKEKWEEK